MTTRPCCAPGCHELVTARLQKGYCDTHADKRSHWAKHQAKKGNTTERGYGHAWRIVRARILRRDKGLCQCEECAKTKSIRIANEVDHIVPKSQGGTDDETNLRAINEDCHKKKTQRESRSGRV